MNNQQTALQKYFAILKFHGVFKGTHRVFDQIFQVDMYDWIHSTNTGQIMQGDEFLSALGSKEPAAIMHYQPVYTASVRAPLDHLIKHYPDVGASSTCFLDLGCGRGKALHVAKSMLPAASLLGVELHPMLMEDAWKNLGLGSQANIAENIAKSNALTSPKAKLLLQDVNDVDYATALTPYDVVIVFNKNSFDRATTKNTLEKIQKATSGKSLYYIYNNPVFSELFGSVPCIYEMSGWHKNWNTKVFRITE